MNTLKRFCLIVAATLVLCQRRSKNVPDGGVIMYQSG
jgi:hypothetical protein